MIRPILTELALFLAPFVAYALFLWATKRGGVLERHNWPFKHVVGLVIAAIVLIIVSFFLLAESGGIPAGSTYVPAHIEDGKLVPGETK